MIVRRLWSTSIKNRLTFLFFSITTGAILVIYFYVVPQLQSNLTSQKLDQLVRDSVTYSKPLQQTGAHDVLASRLEHQIRTLSEESGTRVTLMGIPVDRRDPNQRVGDIPPYVISDSQDVDTRLDPSNALVLKAARSGHVETATRGDTGGRLAQAARPLPYRGQPSWVVVFSEPLDDVHNNVALIRRQVLIAGVIALLVAMASGYYAASVLSRRVKRLERAAGDVAAGNFSRPIPIDSEDELGQLAEAFNEMQRRLAQLDRARKEFIANASHELRTPIFSLGGFVELLQDEDLDADTRGEFLSTMREQVNRLEKLTTDLLDLSRLDAGSLELEREPIALHPLAAQVAREFEAAAARAGSSLEVAEPDVDFEVEALCDPQRVAQIVRALLDNALTHTPSGTRIEVSTGAGLDRTAYLEVRDDGPGIKRRDLGQVFERFHTGSPGRSGLGLSIARELANRMRGRLEVRSRPGETVFQLTLPLAGGRPQPASGRAGAPAAGTRA